MWAEDRDKNEINRMLAYIHQLSPPYSYLFPSIPNERVDQDLTGTGQDLPYRPTAWKYPSSQLIFFPSLLIEVLYTPNGR